MATKNQVARRLGALLKDHPSLVVFEPLHAQAAKLGPLPLELMPYFALMQELWEKRTNEVDEAGTISAFVIEALCVYVSDELENTFPSVDRNRYDFQVGPGFVVYMSPGEYDDEEEPLSA